MKTYRQKQGGILIILVSYVLLIIVEIMTSGVKGINWFGISIVGLFVIWGMLRIRQYGSLLLENNKLYYYNLLFKKRKIDLNDISEIEIDGLWFSGLKVKCFSEGRDSYRRILLGSFSRKQLVSLVNEICTHNDRVTLGVNLKKIIDSESN